MTYLPGESKVIYYSKDGKQEKVFDALAKRVLTGPETPLCKILITLFILTRMALELVSLQRPKS
jgi:hypothetical protein